MCTYYLHPNMISFATVQFRKRNLQFWQYQEPTELTTLTFTFGYRNVQAEIAFIILNSCVKADNTIMQHQYYIINFVLSTE